MRPLRTASIAVSASSSILQNHCSETIGSTRAPERWQKPTEWCSGCSSTIRPSARSWASAASWPSSSENPSHSGFRSRSRPCSSMNSSVSSPWSRPISKSVGSWPGVTFRPPVPNPSSTRSSAMIGTGRSTSGTIAVRPIRWFQRGSSGCTATPVSARIVTGRTVAITISPPPSTS